MNGMLPNADISREIIRRQHHEDHERAREDRLSRMAKVARVRTARSSRRARALAIGTPTVAIVALLVTTGLL